MKTTKWLAAVVLGSAVAAVPAASHAGVFIGITIAPPAIPVYVQPVAPAPDMIWTPGYWQWDASVGDYFWVPGAWVAAPQPGYLWTPGYWGFTNGFYGWNAGYWGPHIGYYGGVNYGFGFFGHGYEGGYWNNNHFFYNTAYSNVNVNIVHNTYIHNTTIINNNVHTSYVGGQGGLQNRPSPGEQAAFREQHVAPTQVQQQHVNFARQDRAQFAQQNHGVPQAAALSRPVNSAQGFRQAALPARAAGNNFTPQPGNSQQRGFVNDGGSPRIGSVPTPGNTQQRGFANTAPAATNTVQQQRGFVNNAQPATSNTAQQQRGFTNPGQQGVPQQQGAFQQRGFANPGQQNAPQQRSAPATTDRSFNAPGNREAYGQGNAARQFQSAPAQTQAPRPQQQFQQARPQPAEQRTQPQSQHQQAPRPENHGGHEERPR